MKLLLVRHGETIENANKITQGQTPGTLSEKGWEQIRKVAKELEYEQFDQVWSSDLQRCVDTATEIMSYHKDKKIQFNEALREYSYGILQGKPFHSFDWEKEGEPTILRKAPGGENALEVATRLAEFFNHLLSISKDQTFLIITHGGPIRVMRAMCEQVALGPLFKSKPANASISRFEINEPLDPKKLVW